MFGAPGIDISGETAFGAVNEHRPRDSRSVANESRIVN
jgi:hypothetical protein